MPNRSFIGQRRKNCTVDQNAEMASLTIHAEYAGTVSLGAATLTLTAGDFNAPAGRFNAGTSTLKFTGDGLQRIYRPQNAVFFVVENAKTSNKLHFYYYYSITLDTLKVGPGTITELPWDQTTVAHLDLQGAAGTPATLRSNSTGNPAEFRLTGSQVIAHVYFQDIDASWNNGKALRAQNGGLDGGNNRNIEFGPVRVWDGEGADEFWSNPLNWAGDVAPQPGESVHFDGALSTKPCTVDQDVEVNALKVFADYSGPLSTGSSTLTINGGDVHLGTTAGQVNAAAGAFVCTGAGASQFVYPANAAPGRLANVKLGGTLTLSGTNLSVGTLQVGPGTTTRLAANWTVTAGAIELVGAGGAYGVLTSAVVGQRAKLKALGAQAIAWMKFRDIDAAGGPQLDAPSQSLDLGNNLHILFAPAAGATLPTAGIASPLCVEGWLQGGSSPAITVSNGGADEPVTFVGSRLWFHNAALDAAAPVTITVKDNGTVLTTGAVAWTPTELTAGGSLLIRQGDSLLLTGAGAGAVLEIDGHGDGVFEAVGVPGDTFPTLYADPGVYVASVRLDGVAAGSATITVVGLATVPPIGVRTTVNRFREIPVSPAAQADQVVFEAPDPAQLQLPSQTVTTAGVELQLNALTTGVQAVAARLGQTGPILGAYPVHAFTISVVTLTEFPVFKQYGDGDRLVGSTIRMTPRFTGHEILLESVHGGAVFETSGATTVWVPTADFDRNDQYGVYMVTGSNSICHKVSDVREVAP